MMIFRQTNGLKGQFILAQGKRSGALGWRADRKIVRAITSIKEKILFQTKQITLCFPKLYPGLTDIGLSGRKKAGPVRVILLQGIMWRHLSLDATPFKR